MKRFILMCLLTFIPLLAGSLHAGAESIRLKQPRTFGRMSLEEAIQNRRSIRSYENRALTEEMLSQILWAAQGITAKNKLFRSVPSAGAAYPLEVYAVTPDGIFHYDPKTHSIESLRSGDLREELRRICHNQSFVSQAGLSIVLTGVSKRVTSKYGSRGTYYVALEAGHAAQNIHLEAVALGLGSVPVGAFDETALKNFLSLPEGCEPLYVIPVGYPSAS